MTKEIEKELVEFYLAPNSAREIERKYGVNLYQLKKLLAKYNVPMHSKSDAYKLRDERTKEVCLNKYGVVNPFAAPEIKEKIKQTMIDRYGVEYVGQAEISKQKTKEAFLERYGVDSYTRTKEFKEQYRAHSAEYKKKEFETKKRNRSYSTSGPEERCYRHLVTIFGENDVLRQYRDERYPFHCDFYIVSKDLFIELNQDWTHGRHPFDAESQEDLNTLAYWQERAKDSEYYCTAINTWTVRDTTKLATAKAHQLNYEMYYKEADLYARYA